MKKRIEKMEERGYVFKEIITETFPEVIRHESTDILIGVNKKKSMPRCIMAKTKAILRASVSVRITSGKQKQHYVFQKPNLI